jgi:hypothetical protein
MRYGLLGLFAGAAATAAYAARARPRMMRWGATEHELQREWPGDAFSPDPETETTRAVTIQAPVADVWRWIVQIGQDRAGFYSYEWLENLFGYEIHNVDRIVPEFQERKEGEVVWLAPQRKFDGKAHVIVALLEKERAMVLVDPDDAERVARGLEAKHGFWAFEVEPVDDTTCRLVMRNRSGRKPSIGKKLSQRLFWEWADFIMERKMMLTIKELAEREARASEKPEVAEVES